MVHILRINFFFVEDGVLVISYAFIDRYTCYLQKLWLNISGYWLLDLLRFNNFLKIRLFLHLLELGNAPLSLSLYPLLELPSRVLITVPLLFSPLLSSFLRTGTSFHS